MGASSLGGFALALGQAATAAGGGDHGDGHVDWLFVASLFTNSILFFGFLFWKVSPLVSKGLKNRRSDMAVELERAQEKQAAAEARLSEYKAKLDNLENEVARVVESYENQARTERERIEQDAEKAIARLARETDFTIGQEMKKAERLIREKAVDATLAAAETKIKRRIKAKDQRRLADQYVDSLNRMDNGRPS